MNTELCDEKNISRETYDNIFRVATLNVHQWRNDNDGDNTTEIANLIAPYKLDIIGLQEARHNVENTNVKLVQLSTLLDMKHITYAKAGWEGFGNAILSRHAISDKKEIQAIVCWERRSMATANFDSQHPFLKQHNLLFHCVHLDVNDEFIRVEQLEVMKKHFDPTKFEIVVGDFNALDLNDYSHDYLEKIRFDRLNARRDEPSGKCITWMKEQGFVDTWREVNTEQKDASTCRFGTRIDFVWTRGELNGWKIKSCEIVSSKQATDHELVICEFNLGNNCLQTKNDKPLPI
jgi:endonuclease/exonuclease/phosphatase family metal-dependent hydrolase